LDEPTPGLDRLVRREFLESMLEPVASGKTVLHSSHQISEVERVADSIAILHRGKFRAEQIRPLLLPLLALMVMGILSDQLSRGDG
jgi:ABC-type multidrug transport system ATPase subunit